MKWRWAWWRQGQTTENLQSSFCIRSLIKAGNKSFLARAKWTGTTAPSSLGHGVIPVGSFRIYTRFLLYCVTLKQMHAQTLYSLCSYAQIPLMVEMSLVLEAPAAQRSRQHQALAQGKALHAHLKLQVAFLVGTIAKSRATFGLGIFQIWTPAWIFQTASYFWKKGCPSIALYLHSPTMPWPTSHTLHGSKFPGSLLSWNKLAHLNASLWSLCSSVVPVQSTPDSPHP